LTDLVTISPKEVPRPYVLIWILNPLLQRRQVLPMLPMLPPQIPGIDAAEDEAGNDDADMR